MTRIQNIRRYCYEPEKIENYSNAIADKDRWDCHHRVETIMNCGAKELIAKGAYWNRPAHELIFLKHRDHARLHFTINNPNSSGKSMKGKHHSEDAKMRISSSQKGRKFTDGHLKGIREAHNRQKRNDVRNNIESIRRLRCEGWTLREIAERFNCAQSLICVLLNESKQT